MTPRHARGPSLAGAVAALVTGCVHQRDFVDPAERITHRTAYTLRAREVRVDAGLIGEGIPDLGATIGVHGAPTRWLELGLNAAHAALGILSVDAKANIVDHDIAGLGFSAALVYTNPSALYVLPDSLQEDLGNFNLVLAPLRLTASFPVARWVALHATVGYIHAEISGRYDENSVFVDGGLGSRDLFFEPQATFYAGRRVALYARAHLSALAFAYVVTRSTIGIEPGLEAGVVAVEWQRAPFTGTDLYTGGMEIRFGRNTHMMLSATFGRLQPLRRPSVLPSLGFYWRFGGNPRRRSRSAPRREQPKEQSTEPPTEQSMEQQVPS